MSDTTTRAGRDPQADLQAFIETHHDNRIRDIASEAGVETILSLPGVWEAVSEAFNNEAIQANQDAWCEDKGIDTDAPEAIEGARRLSAKACVFLLREVAGVDADEDDDIAELRTAIQVNVADGTIEPSDVLGEL